MQRPLFNRANHSNRGQEFENELSSVHDFYRLKGLADVVMNPRDWAFISERDYQKALQSHQANVVARTGDGRPMRRVRSDVDFSGGGARFSICFDAKTSNAGSFPLDSLTDHQIRRLAVSAKCGTISGFMVRMSQFNRVFFLPVAYADKRHLAWIRQTGRAKPGTASISIAEFEENAIEIFRNPAMLWDWLPQLVK